ncbi:MAG: carboxypeptidase M32 [Polyangia bacterium]
MRPSEAYQWLDEHYRQTSYLASAAELLAWDQRTCLPRKGHAHRAEQMAALARLLHEKSVDPRIADRLADVEGSELVDDFCRVEAVNVRHWRRDHDRSRKLPVSLSEELARAAAASESAWEASRRQGDWNAFAPHLERLLSLLRRKARALAGDGEPYDALLDEYEPGETVARLAPMFDRLREALSLLLKEIEGSKASLEAGILELDCSVADQEKLVRAAVTRLGYDLEAGRIDVAAHPFTVGIGPGDVRITTRHERGSFAPALFGAIHEAGHAMYEQGLPAEHWGRPRGEPASLGVHESQSRLWENMVCRSAGFWEGFLPEVKRMLPELEGVGHDDFASAINAVAPGPIRVEADEVTYNLHILMRFELEMGLLSDDLKVGDLPGAWNEKMRDYLHVAVSDPALGVMQDVHWAAGLVGYFPTYTLGNIYAAQLYRAAGEQLGDLQEMFSAGRFAPLLKWLRERVHRPGGTFEPRELICRVSGAEPDESCFVDYCRGKYGTIYEL